MKAVWTGHIRFSLVSIPIRLYNAIETGRKVKFRQLHREDNSPIQYKKVCRGCEEVLSQSDIVKGYEYSDDNYVIIEPDDLEKLELKSTKVIEILAFVDENEVHSILLEKPYYVGPSGDVGMQGYQLLASALNKANKVAIAKVVIRERENTVVIAPKGDVLVMYELLYDEEIREEKDIPEFAPTKVDESQVKLAETLIAQMTKEFSSLDLKDRYYDKVMDLIEKKVSGKEIIRISEEEEVETVDIMSALKASIKKSKTA